MPHEQGWFFNGVRDDAYTLCDLSPTRKGPREHFAFVGHKICCLNVCMRAFARCLVGSLKA